MPVHPAPFPVFLILLIVVFAFFIIMISLAIKVFIYWIVYSCYERIPRQFRVRDSWMVWLLFIPFFRLVWIFFIYPSLATSYKKYFDSIGRTDVGDCGYSIALAYCICACCAIVPYIGILPGIAALVLLIIFLVKAWDLRAQIPPNIVTSAGTLMMTAPPQAAPPPINPSNPASGI